MENNVMCDQCHILLKSTHNQQIQDTDYDEMKCDQCGNKIRISISESNIIFNVQCLNCNDEKDRIHYIMNDNVVRFKCRACQRSITVTKN